ncbi:MAG: TolC family protein [Acidobacteriota bacterium]|nr:TolC family protein [Acidobacteriota bacterium]
MRRTLTLIAALLAAHGAFAAKLTFEQVLARAEKAHDVSPSAIEAADLLDTSTERIGIPVLRIETGATTANSIDVFARNVFRYDALTALLSVDYPLLDGGIREKQVRVARLDAQSFRQRLRESSDNLFRETLEAVARLYNAQERFRILNAGLKRAVEMRERARQMLEMQEISNVTAAQWQDEAIVAESQLLDLELQRLEAETHVRQLMGDTDGEPLEIVLQIDEDPASRALALAANPEPLVASDEGVARATMLFERKRLELQEAEAARRPQLSMSAFGGMTAMSNIAGTDKNAGYGLFGIRFTVALPMFDAAAARRVAEARVQAEQANLERRTTTDQIRRQTSSLWLGIAALEKRIALLRQMVDIARSREESIIRLVAAGVRPENDVAEAAADRARRESDLLAARIELWKYNQIVKRRLDAERSRPRSASATQAPVSVVGDAR